MVVNEGHQVAVGWDCGGVVEQGLSEKQRKKLYLEMSLVHLGMSLWCTETPGSFSFTCILWWFC